MIVGNMGASLHFSANTENDDESEDEEIIIISDAPLVTSLRSLRTI